MKKQLAKNKGDTKAILLELIKLPENQLCADCSAKGPRWASASLGVFMCIKCSGIHRNLGTHLSFVRSVNLDEWKPEQVNRMVVWGNGRAKAYFEHDVPATYPVPNETASVQQLTRWIRDKYEHCKFVPRGMPERDPRRGGLPLDGAPRPAESAPPAIRKAPTTKATANKPVPPKAAVNKAVALEPKVRSKAQVPPVSKPALPTPVAPPPQQPQPDLLDFSEPEPVPPSKEDQQLNSQPVAQPQQPAPLGVFEQPVLPSQPTVPMSLQDQQQQQQPPKMSPDAILAMYAGPSAFGGLHPAVTPTLNPARPPMSYPQPANGFPAAGMMGQQPFAQPHYAMAQQGMFPRGMAAMQQPMMGVGKSPPRPPQFGLQAPMQQPPQPPYTQQPQLFFGMMQQQQPRPF